VLSTHILSDLERVAFDVAFMRDGRISLQAPLDELLDHTRQVNGSGAAIGTFISGSGAQVIGRQPDWSAQTATALVRLAPATRTEVDGLDFQRVNLEELFMELA
jgi:ABC-2 type transport system ATP-binding protein